MSKRKKRNVVNTDEYYPLKRPLGNPEPFYGLITDFTAPVCRKVLSPLNLSGSPCELCGTGGSCIDNRETETVNVGTEHRDRGSSSLSNSENSKALWTQEGERGNGEEIPSQVEYEEDRRFGTLEAPWVGEEERWRERLIPVPHSVAPLSKNGSKSASRQGTGIREISDDELATVVSVVPKSSIETGTRGHRAFAAVKGVGSALFVVAVIASVITFALPDMEQVEKNAAHFLAIRPASEPIPDALCSPEVMTGSCEENLSSLGTQDEPGGVPAEEGFVASRQYVGAMYVVEPSEKIVEMTDDGLDRSGEGQRERRAKLLADPIDEPRETEREPAASDKVSTSQIVDDSQDVAPEEPAGEADSADTMAKKRTAVETNTLDALLSVGAKEPKGTDKKSNEKSRLSQKMIAHTIASIAPAVEKCGYGKVGRVSMSLVISGNTGRVTRSEATAREHVGTPTVLCAARTLRLAKFPKFESREQTVEHTFVVR